MKKYMSAFSMDRACGLALCVLLAGLFASDPAFAQGVSGAAPWESPLRKLAQSMCGPVAQSAAVLAMVGAGAMIAFGEVKGWVHNMMIVLLGIGIATSAPTVLSWMGISANGFACA